MVALIIGRPAMILACPNLGAATIATLADCETHSSVMDFGTRTPVTGGTTVRHAAEVAKYARHTKQLGC